MKKKIIGIFVCVLMIAPTLSATGAMNFQTIKLVNDNNYSQPNQNNPTTSPSLITIKIVAKVILVDDSYNLLSGVIKVNDTIRGKYTYDSGIPDSEPNNSNIGLYDFTSSSCGIELTAGGLVFKTNPSDVDFHIGIFNDGSYGDEYIVYSGKNLQLSNGMLVDDIMLVLIDSSSTAFSSDALPVTAPVLEDFDYYNALRIHGYNPSSGYSFVILMNVTKATKSKAKDAYFTTQPGLVWFLERFPNVFPILRHLLKL